MNRLGMLLLTVALFSSSAKATILFDDLGDSSFGNRGFTTAQYQSFSIGATAITLNDVKVVLGGNTDAHSILVNVYSDTGGPAPGSLFASVGTFSDSGLPGSGLITADFTVTIALSANTRYWIGLSSANGSDGFWSLVPFNGLNTGVTGEFVDDSGSIGADSNEVFQMQLSGDATGTVPEPATSVFIGGGLLAGFLLRRLRRA